MTHEFKNIVTEAQLAKKKGVKSVLASVVALDGSSYRRPGVRMLILEDGKMVGAVSGGCVEKEVLLQSESVFKTGESKMMTYDGRYRLGCEGVLYILIESFNPSKVFYNAFKKSIQERESFEISSYFQKEADINPSFGSFVKLNNELYPISNSSLKINEELLVFKQAMPPCFRLIIVGAEHDAVELCKYAALTGWEVTIVSAGSESKSIKNFPEASFFITGVPESLEITNIDLETAIVLMTHNFATDLRYLVALKGVIPSYIGLLGPAKRRDDLLSQFIEYCPDINDDFLECIHGPAGLNIGAETPQEIAVSIVSEVLSIVRNREPISLSKKVGQIHTN